MQANKVTAPFYGRLNKLHASIRVTLTVFVCGVGDLIHMS